jgi:hypothetical protein
MFAVVVTLAALAFPPMASADLIFDASILAPAQGFGTAPRDLTLQGANATESGAIGYNGTTIVFGSAVLDSSVFQGNGTTNSTSLADLPNPQVDDQKYGFETAGALGITNAGQIGILFNAAEPGGDGINVIDVTLKFYTAGGTFLGAIDGSQVFASSNPGNGVAGFTFRVSPGAQTTAVNGWLATGGAGTTMTLEATLGDSAAGPDTFLIYNLNTVVPEPTSILLLGVGLTALGIVRRRIS